MVMGIENFMTPALSKLKAASAAGYDATVLLIWRQILPVVRYIGSRRYNSGCKAACELLGLSVGPVRAPIPQYTQEEIAGLKTLLSALDPSLLTGAAR